MTESTIKRIKKERDSEAKEYAVSRILNEGETEDGVRVYFVSWKGYPASTSTWEPEWHLTNCDEALCRWDQVKKANAHRLVYIDSHLAQGNGAFEGIKKAKSASNPKFVPKKAYAQSLLTTPRKRKTAAQRIKIDPR